jgi:hypothetical protein
MTLLNTMRKKKQEANAFKKWNAYKNAPFTFQNAHLLVRVKLHFVIWPPNTLIFLILWSL